MASMFPPPSRLLIVDIDGLRQDVFHQALQEERVKNLSALLGGPHASFGMHLDPCSTAPSITFCAQSTIFTGLPPRHHGMIGNQFFDRFGSTNRGIPRFYAFDMGDALAVEDAVTTFTGKHGLVGETMNREIRTLYEQAALHGVESGVTYHMVSRGASHWIRPSLVDIARFTKGGGLLGLSAEQYDGEMMDKTLASLKSGVRPVIQTVYFMGLDHQSHQHGPQTQMDYLTRVVDIELGRLVDEYTRLDLLENTLVVVVSDHGQIRVIPDDRHSLRLSFPFDREMGYLFDALGLDVNDVPGEGPNCNAVVASDGGLAHIYLRHKAGKWPDAPRFAEDVLPVARAFWEAHQTGNNCEDLRGALAMVLVRSVEKEGWEAQYQALTPEGDLVDAAEFLHDHPEIQTVDALPRLRAMTGSFAGDVLLVSNYAGGFYFGGIITGTHGGLHPEESLCVASFGWIGASEAQRDQLREAANEITRIHRMQEGRTHAALEDVTPIIKRLMGWN